MHYEHNNSDKNMLKVEEIVAPGTAHLAPSEVTSKFCKGTGVILPKDVKDDESAVAPGTTEGSFPNGSVTFVVVVLGTLAPAGNGLSRRTGNLGARFSAHDA